MRRLFPLLPAAVIAAFAGPASFASTPPSHDATVPTAPGQTVVLEWTGTSPPGTVGAATNSCTTGELEDHHLINLTVPAGTYDRVTVSAVFHIEWDTAGSDLVLTVLKDGVAAGSSDGGTPEENVVVNNPRQGEFNAAVCSFASTVPTPYRGRLTLTANEAGAVGNPPAGLGNAAGAPPRFQNYAPDYPKQGFGMFGGEATLDVNPTTPAQSIFYIGFLETLRLRLDDATSPAGQAWNISNTIASKQTTSDPILVADRDTGRVFALQLLLGPGQSAMDYSDDDGDTWTPGLAGGFGSGADHQGMAVGPYPPGSTIPHPTYPNAVYYCSQDVALVFCSRSDDGGLTFGPITQIYTLNDCQGLHGHPKVAPDGTVYLPVSGCPSGLVNAANSQPAVVVSEDAGRTWTVRKVTSSARGSGGHGSDPSVGIASDNTAYLSYVSAADNRIHMVKTADRGRSWTADVDIGSLAGITAAQFPATVAGDPTRAAVAFFGSTFNGEGVNTANNYNGLWHLYVATTYDGGATYHVTNATPNDPIQKGGICGSGFCRNLLDFFDMVIDSSGRLLVGYEDGCVGGCVTGSAGTFSDQVVIARQSGGRRMFVGNDPIEPAKAGAPRIAGFRTETFAQLNWPEPDDNGSAVTGYTVYRGTAPGVLTPVASVGNKRAFVDTGLDAATTYHYRVSASNGLGESVQGNELALKVGDNAPDLVAACALPGRRTAVDLTGEAESQPPARDIAEMFMAEPEAMPGMIAFTLKFAIAEPPNQGGPTARVFAYAPNGKYYRLQVAATGATAYGRLEQSPDTGIHNTFVSEGTLDAGTGYRSNGTLTMVIAKEKLGLQTGDTLKSVYGFTLPSAGGTNTTSEEAGYFDYKLQGNEFCARNGILLPDVPLAPPAGPTNSYKVVGGGLPLAALGFLALAGLARRKVYLKE